jgi:hypothetical protein
MSLNGGPPADSDLTTRVEKLENDFATLSWLYAELIYGLRLAAATQLAQSLQPQVQQAMVDQIMAGAT